MPDTPKKPEEQPVPPAPPVVPPVVPPVAPPVVKPPKDEPILPIPAPAAPPVVKESDTDAMFKMMIEDLKEEVGEIDLGALSLKDQMVALRAMKKGKKAPPAPPIVKQPAGDMPGADPSVPAFEYKPICETNKPGSKFMEKLIERKAVGSGIFKELGI